MDYICIVYLYIFICKYIYNIYRVVLFPTIANTYICIHIIVHVNRDKLRRADQRSPSYTMCSIYQMFNIIIHRYIYIYIHIHIS